MISFTMLLFININYEISVLVYLIVWSIKDFIWWNDEDFECRPTRFPFDKA